MPPLCCPPAAPAASVQACLGTPPASPLPLGLFRLWLQLPRKVITENNSQPKPLEEGRGGSRYPSGVLLAGTQGSITMALQAWLALNGSGALILTGLLLLHRPL